MYYLFLDAVSTQGYIAVFDVHTKKEQAAHSFIMLGNESTKLLKEIDRFFLQHNISYLDIQNIACVVGPGSFTGVRTISLIVNALAYSYPNIYLTALNFFDLYDTYPIVKTSSKRDIFVKYSKNDIIEIIKNDIFSEKYTWEKVYGDIELERFDRKYNLSSEIDYRSLMQKIDFTDEKRLSPLYIKKPNIS